RFTACILSFEENLAIKNAPPIVNYVSNNWGALHINMVSSFIHFQFYSAICRAVRPPSQNSAKAKKLGGGWANNQRG
ncbi:hypothetical protein ACLBXI_19575, partial [Bacillus cereus]